MRLALEVSQVVSAELEIDSLCALIVGRLAELIEADISALLFVDESHRVLTVRRAVGMSESAINAFRASVDSGLFGEVIAARKPLITLHPSARVRQEAALHLEGGPFGPHPGPVVVAPLVADRRVQGVFVLARSEGRDPFVRGEHWLVDLLCAQVAQSIDNAWLYGQLRALNRELENKVAARTRELDDKARVLEQALRDLKEIQVQYMHREKMASLGQLTAGIAHEINNPLAYATSNVAFARERLIRLGVRVDLESMLKDLQGEAEPDRAWTRFAPLLDKLQTTPLTSSDALDFTADAACLESGERARLARQFVRYLLDRIQPPEGLSDALLTHLDTVLERAAEGLSRVKQIVLDLRTFSRLDEAECQLADLDDGIEATLALTRHLAKETAVRIEFTRGMRESYPCRPSWMNQVVMNLVVNAIQASSAEGVVRVCTIDDPTGVTIEVEDHGTGIAPANLARIFDPFFTTKPVGEGMGLGLSLCYRIVSDHGGRITVTSKPALGTTFSVLLPPRPSAASGTCTDERTQTKSGAVPSQGGGTDPTDPA